MTEIVGEERVRVEVEQMFFSTFGNIAQVFKKIFWIERVSFFQYVK